MSNERGIGERLSRNIDDLDLVLRQLAEVVTVPKAQRSLPIPPEHVEELVKVLGAKEKELNVNLAEAREIASRQEVVEGLEKEIRERDEEVAKIHACLKDAEQMLITAIFQANQKLKSISTANKRKISAEELIKFSHRISASNAVAAPLTWQQGDPERPYPTEAEMKSGWLMKENGPHLQNTLMQANVALSGDPERPYPTEAEMKSGWLMKENGPHLQNTLMQANVALSGDPERPYPTEAEMKSGWLMKENGPHLQNTLMQANVALSGDPERPYPTEAEMKSGWLMKENGPHLQNTLMQANVALSGDPERPYPTEAEMKSGWLMKENGPHLQNTLMQANVAHMKGPYAESMMQTPGQLPPQYAMGPGPSTGMRPSVPFMSPQHQPRPGSIPTTPNQPQMPAQTWPSANQRNLSGVAPAPVPPANFMQEPPSVDTETTSVGEMSSDSSDSSSSDSPD